MKKKTLFRILIIIMLFFVTGCGNKFTMDGKEVNFDKQYKDRYITYNYPGDFKEVIGEAKYPMDMQRTYEYYKDDKKTFVLKVEEYSLGLSFAKMEEDAKAIETNPNYKNVEQTTIKVNGKNLVRYAFKTNDEFGDNTVHFVYYAGYSYMGIYEYIKIYLINIEGKEGFEEAFLSSFKVNR